MHEIALKDLDKLQRNDERYGNHGVVEDEVRTERNERKISATRPRRNKTLEVEVADAAEIAVNAAG